MFEFLEKIKKSISTLDKLTTKEKYVSNPFKVSSNRTIVWTEKKQMFDKMMTTRKR